MKKIDLTLPTPEHNLAFDEALLDYCEEENGDEILRFWEPRRYFVVLGYSNKFADEVNENFCRTQNIPILRRPSGGGTVLQGPGCLNYTLILRINSHPDLSSITKTNSYIMERQRAALESLLQKKVEIQGHTDLTFNNLKFSGNAQRRKRTHLLFHGSFLLNFDLSSIEKSLKMPPKQPDYRAKRSHLDFLTNIPANANFLKESLESTWNAKSILADIPKNKTEQLVLEKYSQASWNLKF